jgi:hypothetical protein
MTQSCIWRNSLLFTLSFTPTFIVSVLSFFLSFLFLPTFLFVFQNRCRVFQFPLTFLSYFLVEFALLFFILARIVDCYPYFVFAVH